MGSLASKDDSTAKNDNNDNNRSRQLNPQDKAYHRSRGSDEAQAKAAAAATTQANQKNDGVRR